MTPIEQNAETTPVSLIPEDFRAFQAYRDGNETPAEVEIQQEETPVAPESEASTAAETAPASEPETQAQAASETKPSDKEPGEKGQGFQKRIDKLTKKIRDLEEQVAAKPLETKPTEPAAPPVKPIAQEGKPQPPKRPVFADCKDWDEYEAKLGQHEQALHDHLEKLADWKANQKIESLKADERKRQESNEQKAAADRWNQQADETRKAHPDFDEVMEDAGTIPVSPVMAQFVSKKGGPQLAYALAKDPAEAARIAQLDPLDAISELALLHSSLSQKQQAPTPQPPAVSKAPAPVRPVGGARASAPVSVYDENTAKDYTAWSKARDRMGRR